MQGGNEIGRSREGRPILAHRLGTGPLRVSLVAGCRPRPHGPAALLPLSSPQSPGASRYADQGAAAGLRANPNDLIRLIPA